MATIVQQTNGEKEIYKADEYTLVQQQLATMTNTIGTKAAQTDMTSVMSQLADITNFIYPESFDAKGDGTTDDTQAFHNMMAWIEANSETFAPNKYEIKYFVIKLGKNKRYNVTGDNILGVSTSTTGVKFKVEGNGASFLHNVTSGQSFIGNGHKLFNCIWEDFSVYPVGASGRIGFFYNTGNDSYNACVRNIFSNVNVGKMNDTIGYQTIFNINGTNMMDNFLHVNCVYVNYSNFVSLNNSEAVNWKFSKCTIQSFTDNAISFNYATLSKGGFTIEDCEMALYNTNETLIQVTDASDTTHPIKLSGRLEMSNNSFTLFNLSCGALEVNGINMTNGSTPNAARSDSYTAKIKGSAFIRFKDCVLHEKFQIEIRNSAYEIYQNALEFDNCNFWTNDTYGRAYPLITCLAKDTGNEITFEQYLGTGYHLRNIMVKNPRYSYDGGYLMPIFFGNSKSRPYQKMDLYDVTSVGLLMLPQSNIRLPFDCVITSLKLYVKTPNTANVNKIVLNFCDIGTNAVDYSISYPITAGVNGAEQLASAILSIPQGKYLQCQYFLNTTQVTTVANFPESWLSIEYKGMNSGSEFKGTTCQTIAF